jgi:Protein of unknown function (DUF3515)
VTVPLLVIGVIFLAAGKGSSPPSRTSSEGPLPAVTVSAPPSTDSRTISLCAQVISALPLTLDGQDLRRTVSNPASPSIVAWGDPAIVLRCGAGRPPDLRPGSSTVFPSVTGQGGPFYDVVSHDGSNVWTTVDRAVYVEVAVPAKYNSAPLPAISRAIAKILPAVCIGGQASTGATDQSKLCVRRP